MYKGPKEKTMPFHWCPDDTQAMLSMMSFLNPVVTYAKAAMLSLLWRR
jgi:hypothetical protein